MIGSATFLTGCGLFPSGAFCFFWRPIRKGKNTLIIGAFIRGRAVLITGAGGSIGAESVNQICTFGLGKIVLFDNDETELHNQGLRLQRLYPYLSGRLDFVTGDVRDEGRLREVFAAFRPQILFHAAAYKHVPMMETNPKEAAKVNVLEQLRHGGSLTVTHSEMKRYFMTVPEAVSLVLQASILGRGGEIFVLDMGGPVPIVEIAEELIRLHGLEPYKDIDIRFTGKPLRRCPAQGPANGNDPFLMGKPVGGVRSCNRPEREPREAGGGYR